MYDNLFLDGVWLCNTTSGIKVSEYTCFNSGKAMVKIEMDHGLLGL